MDRTDTMKSMELPNAQSCMPSLADPTSTARRLRCENGTCRESLEAEVGRCDILFKGIFAFV